MNPSPKAIVRAAQRLCIKLGIEAEAKDAWNRAADTIAGMAADAGVGGRSAMQPIWDAARLAMLKSIIENHGLDGAEGAAITAAEDHLSTDCTPQEN